MVVAEDGVTSLRYFLNVLRALPPANSSAGASSGNNNTTGADASNGTASAPGSGGWGGFLGGSAGGPGGALQILGGGGSAAPKETGLAELSQSLPSQHNALQPGDHSCSAANGTEHPSKALAPAEHP